MGPSYRLKNGIGRGETFLILFFILIGMAGVFSITLAAEKIDINTAPLEDLIKIIHIGEKRALELISLRPFSSLDELTKIKGIAQKRLEDIKNQGLAWVSKIETESQIEPEPFSTSSGGEVFEEEPQSKFKEVVKITYPSGIVINEILPDPEGVPDAQGEYIEIFNKNKEGVSLSGWKITDEIGKKTKIYTFPENTFIEAKGFLVFYRLTTKIILNNDGDSLSLIQPDGKIIDSVNYEESPKGESYNRIDSEWAWSTTLTPGLVNIIPALISEIEEAKSPQKEVKETTPEKEIAESLPKKELAAISKQIPKPSQSLFILLIALAIAISSGIIILILKKKIKTSYNKNV